MKHVSLAEILQLEASERIQPVEDIWDSIASVPESVPLTDAQREELDRRLAAYRRNQKSGLPWNDVKRRLIHIKSSTNCRFWPRPNPTF